MIDRITLIRQRRDEDVREAVFVVIRRVYAHAGEGLAVFVIADACRQRDVCEGAVAAIVIQRLAHAVIGDNDVGPAIIIYVGDGDAERLACGVGNLR